MSDSLPIIENKNLAEFTSWKVGGAAQYYCAPRSIDELKQALIWAEQNQQPVTLLGGGTNVLVSDQGVQGLLIHTLDYTGISSRIEGDLFIVEALGGTQKSEVLKEFIKQRLRPAIFLAGLPGDMAGGVVMNAGVGHDVSPKEFCDIIYSVDVLELKKDGQFEEKHFKKEEIAWSYRKSKNWQPGVITKVSVAWPNEPDDQVLKEVREGNARRKSTQPLNFPSCGSVFKNPEGAHSGALIEKAGLKGFKVGDAQVSEKHANFIVNCGKATATDIDQLIKSVQKTVKDKFQINLTNEVVYLGQW
ncbi:MAG: UDP-N-acetylmuramate dehydrogenase [Bdellovibrionales bacterium]|nr:UDP-N-acetylmuramate dehydrogenase [Bdellovibrionales bacterium]